MRQRVSGDILGRHLRDLPRPSPRQPIEPKTMPDLRLGSEPRPPPRTSSSGAHAFLLTAVGTLDTSFRVPTVLLASRVNFWPCYTSLAAASAAQAVCGCTMSLCAPEGSPPWMITRFPSRFSHL